MDAQPVQSGMVRFVLVGKREGFSGYLGGSNASRHKFPFNRGVCELPFQEAELAKKVMAFFAAYPEGSQELLAAQEAWAKQQAGDADGSTQAPAAERGVRPAGEEPSQGAAAQSEGHAETEAGGSGSVSERDGLQRSEDEVAARQAQIAEALDVFDHAQDDHWTAQGKPKLNLVQQLTGDDTITRAEVDAVGITRKQ